VFRFRSVVAGVEAGGGDGDLGASGCGGAVGGLDSALRGVEAADCRLPILDKGRDAGTDVAKAACICSSTVTRVFSRSFRVVTVFDDLPSVTE